MASARLQSASAARCAALLRGAKQRVATVEATAGGLIGASLLSCPGASRTFLSSCVVYSGRGYRALLPRDVLVESGALERESNYAGKAAYVASKERFVRVVCARMQEQYGADWIVVESGTSGPVFYVPGVEAGLTAIGVLGPINARTGQRFERYVVVETGHSDREANMWAFTDRALALLHDCLVEQEQQRTQEREQSRI